MPLLAVWDPEPRTKSLVQRQSSRDIFDHGSRKNLHHFHDFFHNRGTTAATRNVTTLDHGRKADLHTVHDLFNNQRTGCKDSTKTVRMEQYIKRTDIQTPRHVPPWDLGQATVQTQAPDLGQVTVQCQQLISATQSCGSVSLETRASNRANQSPDLGHATVRISLPARALEQATVQISLLASSTQPCGSET